MQSVLPDGGLPEINHFEPVAIVTMVIPFFGILVGWLVYGPIAINVDGIRNSQLGVILTKFCASGWGFDWLYDRLICRPFMYLAEINKGDVIDAIFRFVAAIALGMHALMTLTQTGRLRWYAANMAVGLLLLLVIVVLEVV